MEQEFSRIVRETIEGESIEGQMDCYVWYSWIRWNGME